MLLAAVIRGCMFVQDIIKWTAFVLIFAVMFYYWYGVVHESKHNTGLLIVLLVSH